MDIRFYNTLAHRVETFSPIDPPDVYMYNCGPTVYDYAHIGNFRAFIFADVLRRFLELTGHRVRQVMNLTDVGHMTDDALADGAGQDKMQVAIERLKAAKKSGGIPAGAVADPGDPHQVAQFFINAFLDDARQLGLKVADEYPGFMPRATQHVPQMQRIIATLIDRGHAYVAPDGAVYYNVQSFPAYGRLSGNTLDQLRGGAGGRVSHETQSVKRHPADFLLWKPDATHLMKWDSPWGAGYPGWHIECSAMAMAVLGRETIDIHTGGEDNIFPHHECEIAQSTGATGKPFARFWMHTRFLLVDGQKMSKSKGNFYTVRDVLEGKVTGRPMDPAVLRYELLKSHYRSNMNFTAQSLQDSAHAVRRLREFRDGMDRQGGKQDAPVDLSHPVLAGFAAALADDLNMSEALAVVFKWIGSAAANPAEASAVLARIDSVLSLFRVSQADSGGETATDAQALCTQIDAARKNKDFAAADRIRKELIDDGYDVMTTPSGTTAKRRLA